MDRFANEQNTKLKRFNSTILVTVDDFSQNWQGENNWIVLPVYLISSTVKHLFSLVHKLNFSGHVIITTGLPRMHFPRPDIILRWNLNL